MNSLTYLSRQFDAGFATPNHLKAPPSTPTKEEFLDLSSPNVPLKRVKTWSTRSFLFARASSSSGHPQRSYSSPSVAGLATTSNSVKEAPVLQKRPESLISRIFFLRVLALAWDTLRAAWNSAVQSSRWARNSKKVVSPEEKPLLEESSESSDDDSPPPTARSPQSTTFLTHSNSDPLQNVPNISVTLYPPSSDSVSSTPRSTTPILAARKTPFHSQKTLVLDLDETLIHSTTRPISSASSSGLFGSLGARKGGPGHVVEVMLGGRRTLYHVYKRPFVDFFLRTVSIGLHLVLCPF